MLGLMSPSMRLRTMFGCFHLPSTLRSKYSSASLATVMTVRAASIFASATGLRSCFSPATSWSDLRTVVGWGGMVFNLQKREARINTGFAGRLRVASDALKPYSMFCTCSRICSIATFISTATVVSSRLVPN